MFELLIVILIAVILARFVGELMERAGYMALLGELLAGVVLGVIITLAPLPYLDSFIGNEVFKAIASLGMFFLMLMLMAGMEMDIKELPKASKVGLLVALGGVVLPLGLGYVLGLVFLPESGYKVIQSLFLGIALSITAIPALSRVLIESKQIHTKLGHTIMNAAIMDEILGLILVTVLTTMIIAGSEPKAGEFGLLIGKVVGFFVLALAIGQFLMPYLGRQLHKLKSKEIEFSIALAIALAFGFVAEYVGMHFIIGALIARMFLREGTFGAKVVSDLESKFSG